MKQYYQHLAAERLRAIFDEQDARTVLTWLISNDGRPPVVVVGAGFSLNAINKRTGAPVTRKEVPLWIDVLKRFAADLRLDQGGYDALTFAELHYEEMERATFNSTLLEMTRDDDLAPGDAHAGLFAYPKEAVVTTNQLDTLLDKNDRKWRCIAQDSDLALRPANDAAIDIIYFHGHRSDSTRWVFTRSQYEGIYTTRPLIVTKVRQLLSQHPVLIVGYSLSDPDFHHIYRQISLDMANHHPLGLALFPHRMGPSTPERRHWEKLGIRIATFKSESSTSESFKKFFEINPNPTEPLEGSAVIRNWIRKGRDFGDRSQRAQDFLTAKERSKTVKTTPDSETDIWVEPLRCEFTEDEWAQIKTRSDGLQYDEAMTAARSPVARSLDSPATFTGYRILDRKRFSYQDSLSRQLDAFLERRRDLRLDLARWMTFAFTENVIGERKPLFVDLLSWMWRSVADASGDDQRVCDEARGVVRRCFALTLKNNYERERKHIEEDASAIGLDVSGVSPADGRPPEFLQKMKNAFENMLDGAFNDARTTYRQAVGIARQRGDTFDEWVAFHGEEDAVWASISFADRREEASQNLVDDYRLRRLAMEQAPKIAEWLDRTRRGRERVAEKVIENFYKENRRRTVSGRSVSFSVHPYEYWTKFRDLETIHAPPDLQKSYVQPLIDLGQFEPYEELRYRLQLGVNETEKTEDWLTRITNTPHDTLDNARKRDDALLKEFTRSGSYKRERLRRLETFPSIAHIFRLGDLDWVISFFSQCQEDTNDSRSAGRDYPRALCSYADLDTRLVVLNPLEACASSSLSPLGRHEIAQGLHHALPLEQWVGLHEPAAQRLVHLVLGLIRGAADDDRFSSDEELAWALFSVFHGVKRFGRLLAAEMTDEVRQWAARLLQKKLPSNRSYLQGVYSAATHLAHILAPDDGAREEVVSMALTASAAQDPEGRQGLTLGGPMGAWISLIEAGAVPQSPIMAEAAVSLWTKLDGTWDETLRIARSNSHATWPYVGFLAVWIASGMANPLPAARERLLLLVQAAPEYLSLCAEILSPTHWGHLWDPFVDLVWKHSSGGDGTDPVAARLGAVDLLRRWAAAPAPDLAELSADLGFLIDIALLAAGNESPAIANHAAYGITGYASRARSPADIRRIVGGLRRLATDPRPGVRGAAAYAGKRLPLMDVANEVRAVALKIDGDLSTDPYAIIQRQRVFGELDGRFPIT
jgi:SIR2-like domain